MIPVLAARGLTARYGGSTAVFGIDLDVMHGQMVAVAGPNGAGKSTLINALAGWSRGAPTVSGEILLDGKSVRGLAPYRYPRLGIQLVPEGKNIFADLTVLENLTLVRRSYAVPERHLFSLNEVFELFPRLHERRSHKGGALSGGERQMLAISRALIAAPRILLLDEPSVGLAPRLIMSLLSVVRGLVDRGLPVLLVEQNVRAALEVCDELYLMERGRIVGQGMAEVMRNDAQVMSAYLGELEAEKARR